MDERFRDALEEIIGQRRLPTYFRTIEECLPVLSIIDLENKKDVFISVKLPDDNLSPPVPIPITGPITSWDAFHVKMPNSVHNRDQLSRMEDDSEAQNYEYTWQLISSTLEPEVQTIDQFEDMVKNYNRYLRHENTQFNVIRHLNANYEAVPNLLVTLNFIKYLTLQLPVLLPKAVPMLNRFHRSTILLSRQQIACLLANGFYCTFPRRSRENAEYRRYSTFNFASLFNSSPEALQVKIEKLKCIINYFNQIRTDFDSLCGAITFERRVLSQPIRPDWRNSDKQLTNLRVCLTGTIEQDGKGYSQVDFASNLMGASVLHSICYREEILFLTHPELIVTRLFTEVLEDNEALLVNGCYQVNHCTGVGRTFTWAGDLKEKINIDHCGRAYRQFILIDAMNFKERHQQYAIDLIERELNKAYSGFYDTNDYMLRSKPAIASGKWGCGAFNGDPYLKSLIQLLAAAESERDLILYTFNDNNIKSEIEKFYSKVKESEITIGKIYKTMRTHRFPHSESRLDANYLTFILSHLLP